ncbi:MAG: SDR family oxidoreductase [Rhodobacteraceae bacterium]|nr:SDR family oxidoreductase [Paracoccaceae bacterium]
MARPLALITGASGRLGRSMALSLAGQGFDVAVHYFGSKAAATQTADDIRALGRKAVTVQADLLDEAQTEALIGTAAQALGGPLTLLVNNASIFEHDLLQTATKQSWDRHFGSNLRAPFLLVQNFAAQAPPPLTDAAGEKQAQALAVNMLDQRIRKLTPEFMTYTLAKTALWTLTQTAAQALAPAVRVNAIAPGSTLKGARQSQEHFDAQRAASLLQRGANVADIDAALRYFVEASAVTGQVICVDGGQHLGWRSPDIIGQC